MEAPSLVADLPSSARSPQRRAREWTRSLSRRAYVASRLTRAVALRYAYLAYARTLSRSVVRSEGRAAKSLRARLERLLEQDWDDAEAGLYPRALIESMPWREYAAAAPKLLADLPRTRARILAGRHDELDAGAHDRYPRYYARNFHFQTDGYLGHNSAALYDLQVELLFGGTADVMRRRLIPPVRRFASGQEQAGRPLKLLDVACGTGHFLRMLGASLPGARLTGLDLSPHYVAHARGQLPRELDVSLLCENAEALPFPDAHFDAVTCVYLFHELPREVGQRVLGEIARVVRPGGLVVLGDSIQLLDAPELHHELLSFPARFHEPYYPGYVKDDLAARASEAGLTVTSTEHHFVTKVVAAHR